MEWDSILLGPMERLSSEVAALLKSIWYLGIWYPGFSFSVGFIHLFMNRQINELWWNVHCMQQIVLEEFVELARLGKNLN